VKVTGLGKPVWLLDIDGVVNAISKKPPTYLWAADKWIQTTVANVHGEWPILTAQPVVDFINEIHHLGRAEVRWHTTRQEEALDFADAVGLGGFKVAEAPEYHEYGPRFMARQIAGQKPTWWKLPAAERVIGDEKRPLLWTDDDIGWELRNHRWNPIELGTVSPDAATGLMPKHLKMIDKWLKEWEAWSGDL
jgi:hypothetical protein